MYDSRLCVCSGCARSRATTTGSGVRSVNARSSVAALMPRVSASVRTSVRKSAKVGGDAAGASWADGFGDDRTTNSVDARADMRIDDLKCEIDDWIEDRAIED